MTRKLALTAALLLALCAPASALTMLNVVVTAAVTNSVTPNLQIQSVTRARALPVALAIQCKLNYGSGGATASVWVQTSFDGGATWIDVANCTFATASGRFLYNLSGLTPVTTQYTPTDATLAANTAKDGLLGGIWRVKYTTTGTYATNTTLVVDVYSNYALIPQ